MAYTTINKGETYFNTVLYTGNGSTQSITGVGFQPDYSWIKKRSATGNHMNQDAVRGSTKHLHANTNDIEVTDATGVTSFDADGFAVGSNGNVNDNSATFAAWNWLANGTGSSNTAGSINSTVSVNTTAGFSIVSYTGTGSAGATIGHGLGVAPNVIITKARTNSGRYWGVYHSSLGNTGVMALNDSQAFDTNTTYWNDTTPSATLFTVGTNGDTNSSGTMIAYCFAEKTGYSKFGSYVGNGNADGPFIYTGFKPAWVMIKMTSGTDNWIIQDNKRNSFNTHTSERLRANSSGAEFSSSNPIDLYSNGFKAMSGSDGEFNGSGSTYIYMAFAEAPLVGTNNIPATAR